MEKYLENLEDLFEKKSKFLKDGKLNSSKLKSCDEDNMLNDFIKKSDGSKFDTDFVDSFHGIKKSILSELTNKKI